MARTASKTAQILDKLYFKYFESDDCERYRIGWGELRNIAGVKRLTTDYLTAIDNKLRSRGYLLITCDNYFVIAGEDDFNEERSVSQRLVEQYLYGAEEEPDDDDDIFDDDID